jgi:hypothetical protein
MGIGFIPNVRYTIGQLLSTFLSLRRTLVLKTSLAAHLSVERDQNDEYMAVFAYFPQEFKI